MSYSPKSGGVAAIGLILKTVMIPKLYRLILYPIQNQQKDYDKNVKSNGFGAAGMLLGAFLKPKAIIDQLNKQLTGSAVTALSLRPNNDLVVTGTGGIKIQASRAPQAFVDSLKEAAGEVRFVIDDFQAHFDVTQAPFQSLVEEMERMGKFSQAKQAMAAIAQARNVDMFDNNPVKGYFTHVLLDPATYPLEVDAQGNLTTASKQALLRWLALQEVLDKPSLQTGLTSVYGFLARHDIKNLPSKESDPNNFPIAVGTDELFQKAFPNDLSVLAFYDNATGVIIVRASVVRTLKDNPILLGDLISHEMSHDLMRAYGPWLTPQANEGMAVALMIARHAAALNSVKDFPPGTNWQTAEQTILGDPANRGEFPGIVSEAYAQHYQALKTSIFGTLFGHNLETLVRIDNITAFYKATADLKQDQTNAQTVRKDMTDAFMKVVEARDLGVDRAQVEAYFNGQEFVQETPDADQYVPTKVVNDSMITKDQVPQKVETAISAYGDQLLAVQTAEAQEKIFQDLLISEFGYTFTPLSPTFQDLATRLQRVKEAVQALDRPEKVDWLTAIATLEKYLTDTADIQDRFADVNARSAFKFAMHAKLKNTPAETAFERVLNRSLLSTTSFSYPLLAIEHLPIDRETDQEFSDIGDRVTQADGATRQERQALVNEITTALGKALGELETYFNLPGSQPPQPPAASAGQARQGEQTGTARAPIPPGIPQQDAQCVTGDTKLKRRKKSKVKSQKSKVSGGWDPDEWEDVPIVDIKPGDEILSLNESTGQFIPSVVEGLLKKGNQTVWKLTTASGKTIRTTAEHPYLVRRPGDVDSNFLHDLAFESVESLGRRYYRTILAGRYMNIPALHSRILFSREGFEHIVHEKKSRLNVMSRIMALPKVELALAGAQTITSRESHTRMVKTRYIEYK